MAGRRDKWKVPKLRLTRDTILFLSGLGGIIHETFFTHLDRPDLLVLFMAMVGLPAFLRQDEYRRFRGSLPPRQRPIDVIEGQGYSGPAQQSGWEDDEPQRVERPQRPGPQRRTPKGGDYDDLDAG